MSRQHVLTMLAAVLLALTSVAHAQQTLISVSLDTTERDGMTLDGPVDGTGGSDLGATWNQILAGPGRGQSPISSMALLDSQNETTTVGFTTDLDGMWPWGSPDLVMLTSGAFQWVPTTPGEMIFSGLTTGVKYDLYLASFHPNESGSRILFETTNPTTTEGTQIADNGGPGGNDSTWVEGENYAVFENVAPNDNGEIIITLGSDWDTDNTKRAYVSGFQLITSPIQTIAADSSPAHEATDVARDVVMSWAPGQFAATHDVYLSDSLEAVSDASRANPMDVQLAEGQDANSIDPGRLTFGQTYYWRVDEVNAAPDNTIHNGNVWSFEVEPYSIQIPGSAIGVSASSTSNEFSTPDRIIDGSGLGADDTHSMDNTAMWFTAAVDPDPWIEFKFEDIYKMDVIKIWNSNSAAESAIGWSVKDLEIQYSVDGEIWNVVPGPHQLNRAPGSPVYNQYDAVPLSGVAAKFVRLNIQSNWGGLVMSYGLSEIQFMHIPAQARTPVPASGDTDVLPDATISWRAGREAAEHVITMSTDVNAVIEGSVPSVTTSTNSLSLSDMGGELGQTYYWRVDEVNEAEALSVWTGPVWSLSTSAALVVDDFERYNNASPDRPFQTWLDGFGYSADEFFSQGYAGNGTGSGIGHDIWSLASPYFDGDLMETLITMEGSSQSMPFYYDNSTTAASAETTVNIANLQVGQDWSGNGIGTLTLHFRADSVSEALDTTSSFTTAGSAGWFSQGADSYDNEDAAQSKEISDNEQSSMQTTVNGAGTVSFYWKVSSEADWDFLEFSIDGSLQDQISGEVDWQQMTYTITDPGSHTLEWRYTKDGAVSGGDDRGWVDQLAWDGGGQPATMPGNTGQLYVKVNGVKLDYPGPVTDVRWTPWNIDLASLGVNLQDVTTLTLGIDGANAKGLLYLDNFLLESQ
ncbi:MAG: discoidin domain-containing protein [Phycisphaeraceae bacterium]|nr:discoidin domain-containing protein [Phycisphaeraceae bacterium]